MKAFAAATLTGLLFMGATAWADHDECLREANNHELLEEIERRMGGGGGGPGETATARFVCDAYGDLGITLFDSSGNSQQAELYIGTKQKCQEQASVLSNNRQRIRYVEQIALCDTYGDMTTFTLSPDGTLRNQGETHVGSYQDCLSQAEPINRGVL